LFQLCYQLQTSFRWVIDIEWGHLGSWF
jgi:hypothetical protein